MLEQGAESREREAKSGQSGQSGQSSLTQPRFRRHELVPPTGRGIGNQVVQHVTDVVVPTGSPTGSSLGSSPGSPTGRTTMPFVDDFVPGDVVRLPEKDAVVAAAGADDEGVLLVKDHVGDMGTGVEKGNEKGE